GWTTPDEGGLNFVTDYDVDQFGRVIREYGPVHEIQVDPAVAATVPVRQVLFTVYMDAAREIRRAKGYATGSAGSYTFKTVGSVVITRTVTDAAGTVEERLESIRENNAGALSASET